MLRNRTINKEDSLLDALKKMDLIDKKLLIVMDSDKFAGLLSAGDIQRAIIRNKSLDTAVIEVLRKNIRTGKTDNTEKEIRQMMLDFRMELCPVIDENNNIVKVYFWEDLFSDNKPQPKKKFHLPVVIMAGGIGSRLKPITNIIPKPLIPIDEKTILEHIFDRFNSHGCEDFYLSVNYKADLIEYYLNSKNLNFNISYFKEDKPLGTAGSLTMLKDIIHETFFVSNCDIIIEQDYSEILDYHREQKNLITIVAALKHYHIPYGTVETGENGRLVSLVEKPEITYKINSGMYILEPEVLNEIPENNFFHITHLIEKLLAKNEKVGVFPVSEKSWKDIGEWKEYIENYAR